MSQENRGADAMNDVDGLLSSREHFYGPVSLETDFVFCGDDRPSEVEEYIHLFGGSLNVAYNFVVMQEYTEPGSVEGTFESEAEAVTSELSEAGYKPGVHSDTTSEGGNNFKNGHEEGEVGCGYAGLRQAISSSIAENPDGSLADAKNARPELFKGPNDDETAAGIIATHGRLAGRDGFFTTGRRVVLAAVLKGAAAMVVEGDHDSEDGIINLVPGTSVNTSRASKAGLPVYNQDSWAAEAINDKLRERHPFDKHVQQIGEVIDTVGTMRALGVKTIGVRRPAAVQPDA